MDQIKFEIRNSHNEYPEPLEISWKMGEHNAVKIGSVEFHCEDITEITACLRFIEENYRTRFC